MDHEEELFPTSRLIPVSQWIYHLYKVSYFLNKEDTEPKVVAYAVSTDTHICGEAEERCPGDWCTWITWDVLAENVAKPKNIGSIYGMPLSEDCWTAGKRAAIARGFAS